MTSYDSLFELVSSSWDSDKLFLGSGIFLGGEGGVDVMGFKGFPSS